MGSVVSLASPAATSHEQLKVELARAVFWEMERYEESLRQPGPCHGLVLAFYWIQNMFALVESMLRLAWHGCMWFVCYLLVMCTCAGESYQAMSQLARSSRYPYAYPAGSTDQSTEQLRSIAYSGPALQLYHHTRMYALYSWLFAATLSNILSPCNPALYVYEDFVSLERPNLPGYRPERGCLRGLLSSCISAVCRSRRLLPEASVAKGRLAQLLLFSFHPISACHPAACLGPCCMDTWRNTRIGDDKQYQQHQDAENPQQPGGQEGTQCRCCWDDWPERLYHEEQRVAGQRIQATKKFYQEAYNVNSFEELFEVAQRSNSIPLANSRRMTDVGGGSIGRSSSRPSVSVAVPVSQPALEA